MMPVRAWGVVALALCAGCKNKDSATQDTGPSLPTGWFEETGQPDDSDTDTDTDTQTSSCDGYVVSADPADGTADWYYRDTLWVYTSSDDPKWYTGRILDPEGAEVSSSFQWAETGSAFTLTPDEPLAPATDYTLETIDCYGLNTYAFTTDVYGAPIVDGPASLNGRVFAVDLSAATWVEPEAFGAVLALYFTKPILISVQWADSNLIDLLGAPGDISSGGDTVQDLTQRSWDFPVSDFDEQPFFELDGAAITIAVSSSAEAPVTDFLMAATFSPDGQSMGGGQISGLADTRSLGSIINQPDNDNAICDFAQKLAGVECSACPDGEPYCIQLTAENVVGNYIEGLVLLPV